jgi:tetratricopeptide (TPR) repeat protein
VAEARKTRLRIATSWLERLSEPDRALEALRDVLQESPGNAEACTLLERVLENTAAPAETRRAALSLLRKNYLVAERPEDVVRVLQRALEFMEPDERRPLHRECGNRLAILGRDTEAIEQYAELLRADPTDTDARKQLRQLAVRSSRHDLHAQALIAAAEACEEESLRVAVLAEAALLHRTVLNDPTTAIDLYTHALNSTEAEAAVALAAAHSLNELLQQSERAEERLGVLERLAKLEPSSAVRRAVLAEAARLAEKLGSPDRALANWQPVLAQNEHDLEALGAVVDVLERNERWPALIEALQRRAKAPVLPQQRRTDLARIAQIQADKLKDLGAAIDSWLAVRNEFGESPETIAAIDELMADAKRWRELVELLGETSQRERARIGILLNRVADIHRMELDQNEQAMLWYSRSLGVDPRSQDARAGLEALLEDPRCAAKAAEALAIAYGSTDDWERRLGLLEHRLTAADTPARRAALLREAAKLHAERGDEPEAALELLGRALPLDPGNLSIESELLELAKGTGAWAVAAKALGRAAAAEGVTPRRSAELRRAEGALYEERLSDSAAALVGYQHALELDADDLGAMEAVVRTAAKAAQWSVAARAAGRAMVVRDRFEPQLVALVEDEARDAESCSALAAAMAAVVAELAGADGAGGRLRGGVAQRLEMTIAGWYRDRCGDLDGAEKAARRAADRDPVKLEAIELLAALQRRTPGPDLVATLTTLDELGARSLDALHEAASVALECGLAAEPTISILEKLYRKAGGMWARSEQPSGERKASEVTEWALDRLVAHHIMAGHADQAVQALRDGARLPIDPDKTRELRRRAAEMLAGRGDRAQAIDLYRGVLESAPKDLDVIRRLAELCEQEERISEALALRLRELPLIDDPERRLALRLELARLTGVLEERGGRIDVLRANLSDQPGHVPTIDALCQVLVERGRFKDLAQLLGEQAAQLETRGEPARAAQLWSRAAALAEEHLRDVDRAIAAHTKVVELEDTNPSIDALARLHLERNEPAEAAKWLERRLEHSSDKERVAVLLQLARARIQAEKHDAAMKALQTAFSEAPRNAEVRKLLFRLYRTNKNWGALASGLSTATEHVADEQTVLAYAREAAEIYRDRLSAPADAVPVLRKAIAIAPDERQLKAMLAEGLRVSGKLDEAQALLSELIEGFGRRRSTERAALHLQLARVQHAQGSTVEAIDELDKASTMDASNVTILFTLAELARESGQLDRAERAYRTLLLKVRRAPTEEEEPFPIGPCEVLLELGRIARDRGQPHKAHELADSAMEALTQSDLEAPRLESKLREQKEFELLHRVLETRLAGKQPPRRRAEILAKRAELLETALQRPDDALDARLQAMRCDPASPIHHQAAWDLAARLAQLDRYVAEVGSLLSDTPDSDAHVRCELLLRLGEVHEKDRRDLDQARDYYAQAESTGVRTVDVWRAQSRLAGARGDEPEQLRLLGLLASLGEDQVETRASALYRMAEVQMASAESLAEGIESLRRALEDDPRIERAGMILRRAADAHPGDKDLLDLYERAARGSDDKDLLLHYLERRSGHPSAAPEQAREAANLALDLGQPGRAEALMLRAAEIGQAVAAAGGVAKIDWALLGLAKARMDAGDLAGAVKWLGEAAEVAGLAEVFALGRRVAELAAAPGGDLTLAAKLYERLRERDPMAREAWQPLADIYCKLGDLEGLERLVQETLDGLKEPGDRNALRLELAKTLLRKESRADDAVTVLQDVLVEDPVHEEAQRMLVSRFEHTGDREQLLALLRRQLVVAQERREVPAIKAAALRLGSRLGDGERDETLAIYEAALEWGDDADLLRAVLARLGDGYDAAERSGLLERLVQTEQGDVAGSLALELCELYATLEDDEGVLRALKLGYERAPHNDALRAGLEQRFRERGDFLGLAQTLVDAAGRREDVDTRVALLREAAAVYREQLEDSANAVALMRQACEVKPGDTSLRVELAATLASSGDRAAGLQVLSNALDGADDERTRLELLLARAGLRSPEEDEAGVLGDLESAFTLDQTKVAPALEDALQQARRGASARGDEQTERSLTLRLVDVLLVRDKRDEVSILLAEWSDRAPNDLEALRLRRGLDAEDQRWDAVAATCERLVELEGDAAQIEAALALAQACRELGTPERALVGLERARESQPASAQLRAELRKLYEQTGAQRELAGLMLEEAATMDTREERYPVLLGAGQTFLKVGDAAAAVPALRQALDIRPQESDVIAALADAYILAGWFEDANELLDQAIEGTKGRRTPELCVLLFRKAELARTQGDPARAIDMLKEAHNCNKKNGDVAAALANLAEELEDWDLATKTLRTISLLDTECPISRGEAFLRQGKIAYRMGDQKGALMWARRAKREEPDSGDIDRFIEEIS